jgi:hypothetical protein
MRSITEHHINACNRAITIEAGEPDPTTLGIYEYRIAYGLRGEGGRQLELEFQCGDPKLVGVNGLTNEVLLALLMDRIRSFQNGPLASNDNVRALRHLEAARDEMHLRTLEREERGVEGTRAP